MTTAKRKNLPVQTCNLPCKHSEGNSRFLHKRLSWKTELLKPIWWMSLIFKDLGRLFPLFFTASLLGEESQKYLSLCSHNSMFFTLVNVGNTGKSSTYKVVMNADCWLWGCGMVPIPWDCYFPYWPKCLFKLRAFTFQQFIIHSSKWKLGLEMTQKSLELKQVELKWEDHS